MSVPPVESAASDSATEHGFRPLHALVGLGGIQALSMVAGLARSKILAVLLGPSGMGVVGVVDQVVSFVAHAGALSLPFAAVKYLSARRDGDSGEFRRLYAALLRLVLLTTISGSLLVAGVGAWRADLLAPELGGYRLALALGLLAAPGLAVQALQRSTLAALGWHRAAALVSLFAAIGLVGSSAAGVTIAGVPGLYAGNLLVHGAVAAGAWILLSRRAGLSSAPPRGGILATVREEEGLWRFATGVHVLTLATPLAYLVARVAIIREAGAAAAGLFAAASGLAVSLRVVLNQANALYLTPLVNRRIPVARRAEAVARYVRALLALLMFGAAVPLLFPDLVLRILYSGSFVQARTLLALCIAAEGTLLVAGVYQALLLGLDDLRAHLTISVVAHLAIAAAAGPVALVAGAPGVATVFIAGNAVMLVGTVVRLTLAHGAGPAAAPLGLVVIAGAALTLASVWVLRSAPGAGVRALALAATGLASLLAARAELRGLPTPRDEAAP